MFLNHASSRDLYYGNPTQTFAVGGNTIATESLIDANPGSGKEFSQRSESEELFTTSQNFDLPDADSRSNFHKYISQKPLFGKAGKLTPKSYFLKGLSSSENEDTESRSQIRSSSEKIIISNLCETVNNLTTEVKSLREEIKNNVTKVNIQNTSGEKNAEEVHALVGKFETFLCSYKEHERMLNDVHQNANQNAQVLKNDLKSMEGNILQGNAKLCKTSENICDTQENLMEHVLESMQSIKGFIKSESENSIKNVSAQFLQKWSEKFIVSEKKHLEEIEKLRSFIEVGFQSLVTMKQEKLDPGYSNTTYMESAGVEVYRKKCPPPPPAPPPAQNSRDRSPIRTRSSLRRVTTSNMGQNLHPRSTSSTMPLHPNLLSDRNSRPEGKRFGVSNNCDKNNTRSGLFGCPPQTKRKQDNWETRRFFPLNKNQFQNSSTTKHFKMSENPVMYSRPIPFRQQMLNSAVRSQNFNDDDISQFSDSSSCVSVCEIPFLREKTLCAIYSSQRRRPVTLSQTSMNISSTLDQIFL